MESERQKSHALLQHFAAEKCKVFVCCCCCVYSIHVFETLFAAGVLILRLVSYNTALLPLMLLLRCFCCLFGVCVRVCFHTKLVYTNFQLKPLIFGEANTKITSHFSFEHYDFMQCMWLAGWLVGVFVCMLTCSLCQFADGGDSGGGGDSTMFPFELFCRTHKHKHTQNAI